MAATLDGGDILVNQTRFKRRNVVAKLVPVGQFLELVLMYKSEIIYVCSNDPSSLNYKNLIFGETDPPKILEASIGNIQVIGNAHLWLPLLPVASQDKGRIINQNNTFTIGNIVAPTENGYVKSVLATQDKWGFFIVIEANPTSLKITTDPGEYKVTGHGWGAPGTLLFHAQTDGVLTSTPPTSGQFVPALASVVDENTIYFQPNLINRRLV